MKKLLTLIILLISINAFAQKENATVKKIDKVVKLINTQYVDTVDMPHLIEVAIKAMTKELDPHSKYLTKEELKKNREALNGSFAGVGIHYQILYDTLLVLSTTAGGPSEQAGILPGDRIVEISGQNATGKNITNGFFSKMLRGPKGSTVEVKIKRRDVDSLVNIVITRGPIPIPTLDAAYMLDNTTGYVKINGFSFTTVKEFETATEKLKKQGMKNIIVDLRGNPGGLMIASVRLADEFLNAGELIVYTRGEHYKRQDYTSSKKGVMKDGRLIVLMNEWSASASEIFAGAMQDLDRGLIAGRRSYGKGLVGRNYTLPDGSAIRLTTGHYYTPSGRCIQKPYSDGIDDYRKDLQKRLDHGEYLHADSIHFPDSLKYQTKNGRTVYGGGGIMPDIFFPMDTTSFPGYYNKLFRKGIVNAFAGDYFDKNLGYLQRNFPDVKSFKNNFTITDKTISDLAAFAERQYNLTADTAAIGKTKDRIKIFLKAYIGRNLYENGAYYYLTNETDKVIINSLEIISDKKTFKETKVKWK